jgi:hypothetical protein
MTVSDVLPFKPIARAIGASKLEMSSSEAYCQVVAFTIESIEGRVSRAAEAVEQAAGQARKAKRFLQERFSAGYGRSWLRLALVPNPARR